MVVDMETSAALWTGTKGGIEWAEKKYGDPSIEEREARLSVMKKLDECLTDITHTKSAYSAALQLMVTAYNGILEQAEKENKQDKVGFVGPLFFNIFPPLIREYQKFPDYDHKLVATVYEFMKEHIDEENRAS